MTTLTVWADDDPTTPLLRTTDAERITAELAGLGARFARWDVRELAAEPSQDEVLEAYRDEVGAIRDREGYTLVDVVQLETTDDPESLERAAEARGKFLREHRHDDDEDRFFARGSGIFYLHAHDRVHAVLCEAGDVLSVPAGTTHWFDMGTRPSYVSVRFFHDDEGWVGDFTGSDIASTFPTYDELTARAG